MDKYTELEKFYAFLTDNPYGFSTRKTMIPEKILRKKNIPTNRWGYIILDDTDIEKDEETFFLWKSEILLKLQKNYINLIQKAQRESLIIEKMMKQKVGLETWL